LRKAMESVEQLVIERAEQSRSVALMKRPRKGWRRTKATG
jgi:hypothetical protein